MAELNQQKNRSVTIYLIVIGVIGVALVVLAAARVFGGWAWVLGGLLALSGLGGLAGMKMGGGGFASCPCPACGEPLEFQHPKVSRIMQCPRCGAWAEGAEEMHAVADDFLAKYPAFTVPMPEPVQWPPGCPVCSQADVDMRQIEGQSWAGQMFSMVSPVSVVKTYKMDVPMCRDHKDGVALLVDPDHALSLGFRSRAYQLRFIELNR